MSEQITEYYSSIPELDEASCSQIPAVIQLINMGYNYLTREQIKKYRENNKQYILRDIALQSLREINSKEITDKSIKEAVLDLETVTLDDGINKVSENIYSKLVSGQSVSEIINGKITSPQLKFIDFDEPSNNVYHVCVEFELSEDSERRPDIVAFINGIPIAVIENKKPSVSVNEGIKQILRNQQGKEVPKFFLFPQILIATNVEEFKYGTMLTPRIHYSNWKDRSDEKENNLNLIKQIINKKISETDLINLRQDLKRQNYYQCPIDNPSAQAIGIYGTLEHSRLLDIIRNFIVYDDGIKIIAKYQQFFAIKKALKRISTFNNKGNRNGGLIWHTQGSGKSLSMVMFVKNLIEEMGNVRIVIVTDRRDLDRQIKTTFSDCNIKKSVTQTKSSEHLRKLLEKKSLDVITTLMQKFALLKKPFLEDTDKDIFVLIDEAHRTQSGEGKEKLLLTLPNACLIGFTGTPIMKKDKPGTIAMFNGLIDEYTMSEAEKDGVVLPLVYQGLYVDQTVDNKINIPLDFISKNMSEKQKNEFIRKSLNSKMIEETSQRIDMIAYHIYKHYMDNFKGTGLKAQVVMPSKYSAIKFQEVFNLVGSDIKNEIVISDTNDYTDDQDLIPENKKVILDYLSEIKRKYGSLEKHEQHVIDSFKKDPQGCEIIIVVNKLLTGFDAPVNTALYLARQIKEHDLLQAIARVNRIYEGEEDKQVKVNGFVFDYSKNAKNLKDALQLFSHYDPKDIQAMIVNPKEKLNNVDFIYQQILDKLKTVKDKNNYDDYVTFLKSNTKIRNEFYELINKMIQELEVCHILFSDIKNVDGFDLHQWEMYTRDLKKFIEIKKITQTAMSERIDFSKYKNQIHKLLDKYVSAEQVQELTSPINVSEIREFNEFIENKNNGLSVKSKAEAIASQVKKTISQRWNQDPVFYSKISQKIEEIIEQIRKAKEEDLVVLLGLLKKCQRDIEDYEDSDIPEELRKEKSVHTYYRNLRDLFINTKEQDLISIVKDIVNILNKEKIIDWKNNIDVERMVKDKITDYLFDVVKNKMDINLTISDIENIINKVWSLALQND